MKLPTKYHVDKDEYRIPDRKGGMLKCVTSETDEFEYVAVHGVNGWPSLLMLEHAASVFWPDAPVLLDLKNKRLRFRVLLFARKNDHTTDHCRTTGGD